MGSFATFKASHKSCLQYRATTTKITYFDGECGKERWKGSYKIEKFLSASKMDQRECKQHRRLVKNRIRKFRWSSAVCWKWFIQVKFPVGVANPLLDWWGLYENLLSFFEMYWKIFVGSKFYDKYIYIFLHTPALSPTHILTLILFCQKPLKEN